jgi:rsbT co-antagonist protein RsbR
MRLNQKSNLPAILKKYESELLAVWIKEQLSSTTIRKELIKESELREQSAEFLRLLREASQVGDLSNPVEHEWNKVRELLGTVSRSRAMQGFSPSETANFIFSLRTPLLSKLLEESTGQENFAADLLTINLLIDKFGLYTTEVFQKSREEVINRQQSDMLELSTPVVTLWDKVLALPMIGTLDSARTQVVMETLLQRIVETGSEIAIIDITGVPTVDTLVAQHLLKTVTAARLMGAECIISGIRPQIAATIVHLGVDLGNIITKATLRDAFAVALRKIGRSVVNGTTAQTATQGAISAQPVSPKAVSAPMAMYGNA